MYVAGTPQEIILTALEQVARGHDRLHAALDEIDAPLYITDADGVVTYFNPACIAFTGRTPKIRADRWCVTWKLYTRDGEFLPHDQCPMATTLKEGRAVRGLTAIAERPDGTRVVFMPYPTPIIEQGRLVGAVNILVDITDASHAHELWVQADKARRLARGGVDFATSEILERLAEEYESKALVLGGPRASKGSLQSLPVMLARQ